MAFRDGVAAAAMAAVVGWNGWLVRGQTVFPEGDTTVVGYRISLGEEIYCHRTYTMGFPLMFVVGRCGGPDFPCPIGTQMPERCSGMYELGITMSDGTGRKVLADVRHQPLIEGELDAAFFVFPPAWSALCPFACADAPTECLNPKKLKDCPNIVPDQIVNGTRFPGTWPILGDLVPADVLFRRVHWATWIPTGEDQSEEGGELLDDFVNAAYEVTMTHALNTEYLNEVTCREEGLTFKEETDPCGSNPENPCLVRFGSELGLQCDDIVKATFFSNALMDPEGSYCRDGFCPEVRKEIYMKAFDASRSLNKLRLQATHGLWKEICPYICVGANGELQGHCVTDPYVCVQTAEDSPAQVIHWDAYDKLASRFALPVLLVDLELYNSAQRRALGTGLLALMMGVAAAAFAV